MIFLENEHIKATFAKKGAELQSLKSKQTELEYIWNGDPAYWGKHSPVLFPIVGGLRNNTYSYEGKEYQLSRHGFARDMEFDVTEISAAELLFTLSYNEDTLAVYPFKFKLGLRYKLSGAKISCGYEVANPDKDEKLFFSIGGHPAFAAPLKAGSTYTDCFLEFNNDEQLVYHKIKDDLIDDETSIIKLDHKKLHLRHDLFYNDALVLKTLKSDCVSLKNTHSSNGLHFAFKDFPFFGIWAAKDADFVCLEPWCGIADGIAHNQNLEDKEGIISLSAGQQWQRKWEAEVL